MNGLTTVQKTFRNALLTEKLVKLSKEDKQRIVCKLLENTTERKLEQELGIPRSTLHDWKTGRQDNTEENIHLSLPMVIRKLEYFKPENSEDIQRLITIKQLIEKILEQK